MKNLRGVTSVLLFVFVAGFVGRPAHGQVQLNPADPIPVDPAITHGTFANGMKYYIKVNKKPEKRAELRLAVRTGSVMEDDDQLGLAHFCEHMAFNGTKSFPKNEIVNLLEKEGVKLGPDVNAYTSFDQIVYMLQIPTDSATIVEKAFQILEEWASAATYDDKEIDKERGVVVEEWRLGRGASARVFDKHIPKLLFNSQYAKRYVIGKKEILENAPYETLRRFYRDWYRPELMAVAVVGDFDKPVMEQLVKDHFSKLTNRRPARERTEYTIPDHTQTLVSIATDKELTYTSVQMYFLRDLEIEKTFGDSRKSLVSQLYDGMFNKRLQERLQQPNPPFVYGGAGDGRFLGHRDAYNLFVQAKENGILDGLSYILTEANRVRQFGFTATELERQKTEMLRQYERMVNERDKTESRNYADEYIRNFLQSEPIPGIETEYAVAKQFLPGVTLDEVNKLAAAKLTKNNRVITISAPEKEGVRIPTEAEVLAAVTAAEEKKTDAYVDKVINKPLIATPLAPGKVVDEKRIPSIGVTEWKLSNGVRIVLKPTDFKNDEILFSAYSEGGTSLSPDQDYMSAAFASQVVSTGGVGEFDAISLTKLLSGKIVSVNPMISSLSEGFAGNSSPKDLETLLQLTYLYMTAPRKDTAAFGAIMTRYRSSIQNRSASPEGAYYDTINVTMARYHYRARPMTVKLLDEINLDKALKFYRDRFADASDFTFFFVGSFKPEALKPLIEQYLASLPSLKRNETWKDVGIYPPKGVLSKEVHRGIEPKSTVVISFTGPFEWNAQNRYDFNSLLELTNIKLREVVREEKGGTYGIGASGAPSLYPHPEFSVSISWGCNPQRLDELVKTVMDQLDTLRSKGPDQVTIDKVKEIQRRNREVNLKENRFWLSNLRTCYANGENPEEILAYSKFFDKLSIEAMRGAAHKYFDTSNMAKFVLLPEKK